MRNLIHAIAPPPRDLPLLTRVAMPFHGVAQIGWGLLLAGVFVVGLVVWNADRDWYRFTPAARQVTDAEITDVQSAGFSEGSGRRRSGSRRSGRAVYRVDFAFADATGTQRRGYSHTTSTSFAQGGRAQIEYLKAAPDISRIMGTRRAALPWGLNALALLPVVGLCFVAYGVARGQRILNTLRRGTIAEGTVTGHRWTPMRVNGKRLHRVSARFVTASGEQREVSGLTAHWKPLVDAGHVAVLCDEAAPARSLIAEATPLFCGWDEAGHLRSPPARQWSWLLLPALTLLAAAGMTAYRMGG